MKRDRVLVVESQAQGFAGLALILDSDRRDALDVVQADDFDDAWRLLRRSAYHITVVPSARWPRDAVAGFCTALRDHPLRGRIGILVLTADKSAASHQDVIAAGVDVAIPQDAPPAAVRRTLRALRTAVHERYPMTVSWGDLVICAHSGQARVGQRRLPLPPHPVQPALSTAL